MKILFLNYEYPPLGGGAGVATEAILREWTKDPEIEVHLVTSAVGKAYEHSVLGGRVHIHRLPIGKDPKRLHSQSFRDLIVYLLKALFWVPDFVRREQWNGRFDATLAFFTVPCGSIAYLVKALYGIPYVISLRGADVPGFSEKYAKIYFILKVKVRYLWKRASAVVPNSVGIMGLALKTAPGQKMRIIENGIDTESFRPPETLPPDSPVIFLSTSRLTKRKRIDTLVRAFALAAKRSSRPIELRLISDGEEKESLRSLAVSLGAGEQVKFLGRVAHDDLPGRYQEAHVFVLPSQNEGMSNSALEALASGLPLVVSDTGGMQEIVTDGKNGVFVNPEDIEDFAEALVKLAEGPGLRASLGEESRRRALARGWARTAEQFKEALRESIRPRA